MQTADWIQNLESRLQSRYEMKTENLKSFFVWYVITCHLTTYRASRNRFSAISFHDYLHYCGKFLAHFLMKIDRNIISSLRIVFLFCAQVGLCDVCTCATFEKQLTAFHVVRTIIFLSGMCLFCWQKMRHQNCSFDLIFDVRRSHHINLPL